MASSTDRLVDHDRLEPPLQRGVLLDVLAVLVERGRADHVQLAAGQHRLEHVAGVHRALGGAGADHGVQLVDEQQDPALGGLAPRRARPSAAPRTRRGTSRRPPARPCRGRRRSCPAAPRARRRWRSAGPGPRRSRSCRRPGRRSAPGCSSSCGTGSGSTRRISASRPMTGSSRPARARRRPGRGRTSPAPRRRPPASPT